MAILPHILLLSPLVLTVIGTGQNDERPLVTTKYGQLRGVTVQVKETSKPVAAFFGVPFAKPPVGSLRFAAPKPPEPWDSVREASEYPPMCIQSADFTIETAEYFQSSFKVTPTSEDCLYLNVFTPADRAEGSKLPVMTFIHGGGLVMGSASMQDGSALSAYEKVVVVNMQYRLGILGFFSTGDDRLPSNNGFLDQVSALQWIQENIADFGGDPSRVTIFGESAGAISVSALVLSPLATGLFHRAIAESGAITMKFYEASKPEDLIPIQNLVAKMSGCDLDSIVDCLKNKSEEELIAIAKTMDLMPLPAVVDGVFFPKPTEEMLANKEINKVPFIIGMNNQEFGWITPKFLNISVKSDGMTLEDAKQNLRKLHFLARFFGGLSYIIDEYFGDAVDPVEIRDRFLALCGDFMFVVPALKLANYHRDTGLPVYLYEYQHPPSILSNVRPDFVQADHSDELFSVFGGPFLRDGVMFAGPATNEEKVLSRRMMKYWANFARNGDPNSPDLTEWPQYGSDEHYLEINLEQKSCSKLKEKKFQFWTEILPKEIQSLEENGSDRDEL